MIHFSTYRTEVAAILVCLIPQRCLTSMWGWGDGRHKKRQPGGLTPNNIWHLTLPRKAANELFLPKYQKNESYVDTLILAIELEACISPQINLKELCVGSWGASTVPSAIRRRGFLAAIRASDSLLVGSSSWPTFESHQKREGKIL